MMVVASLILAEIVLIGLYSYFSVLVISATTASNVGYYFET